MVFALGVGALFCVAGRQPIGVAAVRRARRLRGSSRHRGGSLTTRCAARLSAISVFPSLPMRPIEERI
jgi:hypothetical protein